MLELVRFATMANGFATLAKGFFTALLLALSAAFRQCPALSQCHENVLFLP